MPWGRLRLWEAGEGPVPILAVHGLGGSGRYWDGLAEAAGDRYRVLAPDLGGFGGSSAPAEPADRTFHGHALDPVVEEAGSPVVVIGHSLGGVLGLLWAGSRAGSAPALAMASSPFPSSKPDWEPARWSGRRRIVPRTLVSATKTVWPVLSVPVQALGPYPAQVVRDYGRQSLRSRVWTLWSLWGEPGLEVEVRAAANALRRTSVLLAYADDDRSVAATDFERWAAFLPGAEHLRVPTGGHQFLLRDRFASIAPWLQGLAVGDPG